MITNKYLSKVAELRKYYKGDEPFETAVHESVAAIPADIAGGAAGAKLGAKFGAKGVAIGSLTGAALGGLVTNYAVLKHKSLQGQTK